MPKRTQKRGKRAAPLAAACLALGALGLNAPTAWAGPGGASSCAPDLDLYAQAEKAARDAAKQAGLDSGAADAAERQAANDAQTAANAAKQADQLLNWAKTEASRLNAEQQAALSAHPPNGNLEFLAASIKTAQNDVTVAARHADSLRAQAASAANRLRSAKLKALVADEHWHKLVDDWSEAAASHEAARAQCEFHAKVAKKLASHQPPPSAPAGPQPCPPGEQRDTDQAAADRDAAAAQAAKARAQSAFDSAQAELNKTTAEAAAAQAAIDSADQARSDAYKQYEMTNKSFFDWVPSGATPEQRQLSKTLDQLAEKRRAATDALQDAQKRLPVDTEVAKLAKEALDAATVDAGRAERWKDLMGTCTPPKPATPKPAVTPKPAADKDCEKADGFSGVLEGVACQENRGH